MNLWKRISLSVLIIITLLGIAITFLGWTTAGLQLTYNVITNYCIPALKIDQITGNWHNLYMKNIQYERPGLIINVKELNLTIKLSSLYKGNICINNLLLKDVHAIVDSKKISKLEQIKKKDNISRNLFLPLSITFNYITLNNLNFKIDNIIISITKFSSGLHWWKKNLTLAPTSLNELIILVSKNSCIAQREVIKSKVYSQQLKKKLTDNISKNFYLKSFLQKIANIQLPFNLNIKEFKGEKLHLISDINLMIYDLLLKVDYANNYIELNTLKINSNYGIFSISGSSKLNGNCPIVIVLNGILNINLIKDEKIKLKISGMLLSKIEIEAILSGPLNITMYAQTWLTRTGIPIDLKIISNKYFCYSFINGKQFQIDKMELRFSGKITNYAIFFHTLIKGEKTPFVSITLNAEGNEKQLNLNKLTISSLKGKIQFTTLFNWYQYPNISWRSRINLENINIIKEIFNYPLKLNGLIKANGSLCGNNWQIEIQTLKMTGSINKNKILIEGSLKGNSCLQWIISNLNLMLGRNKFNFKGNLDVKKINFDTVINITNLNDISQNLCGTINGIIKLCGTIDNLKLLTSISINNLHWKKLIIKHAQIDNYLKSTNQVNGYLNLNIQHIIHPNINAELISLKIKGNEQQHMLQLYIDNKEFISGQMDLIGSLDRQEKSWKWILGNTYFTILLTQPWIVTKFNNLDFYNIKQKFNTKLQCQNNLHTETYTSRTIDTTANIYKLINTNHFNTEILKSFISKIIKDNNIIHDKIINIIWSTIRKKLSQGNIIFSGYNLKIIQEIDNIPSIVDLDTLNFHIKLHSNYVELKWLVHLINNGQLDGQVKVSNLEKCSNLCGNINIHNFNLAIVNNFLPFREKIIGILNVNLKLVNGVKAPLLFGKMQFNNININIDRYLTLLDIESSLLTIYFNGTYSTFSGVVRTKQGKINLSGNLNWNSLDNWNIYIVIKGNRIRVITSPILQFDISPNLIIEITSNIFSIRGLVDIPWARISVNKLPRNVISVSNDEVILDEKLKSTEMRISSNKFISNLIVHVGSDVYINAFGSEAKLIGSVRITYNKQGINFNGQINIQDGHFYTYGHDMIIRDGKLLFSGPLDQTILNIEAIRNPKFTENNVIVGIRIIILPINEQKIKVFSVPEMSQREALSYLLYGCGINNSQNNHSTIMSVLTNLWIMQSNQIINKIGKIFNINNLTINTQITDTSPNIIVKGYVLPNLQIEYGVGIFNSLENFVLRYNLAPKLYLEIISNINKTIKLLYQFDF